MRTKLGHMQVNVKGTNMQFYRDLMNLLGWQVIYDGAENPEGHDMLGVADPNGASVWFAGQATTVSNDYDGPGMNHLAIGTQSQSDVEEVAKYLEKRDIKLLFGTPQHRPEFAMSPDQTYYQVMFESPDRLLLEVVYTGPKSA